MAGEAHIPAVHALHLAEVVARFGVGEDELFAGLGFDRAALSDPGMRLALPELRALIERARALSGEPGLGFHLGLQMRVSAHGYVGFAALASSTIGEALEVAERFAPTRTDALALRLHRDGSSASLVFEELAPLDSAADVVILGLMLGLKQIGEALTGHVLQGDVDLRFSEPDYFSRFRHLLTGRVRFDQPVNQLVFDRATLELRIVEADPAALRLAREQCERELSKLQAAGTMRARVRGLLGEDRGFPSVEDAAAQLHVSPRTLKRRLSEEGTEFSAVIEEERRERALLLLRREELSIEEITERLGYSDPANFTRAFRRWTGMTPAAFRKTPR